MSHVYLAGPINGCTDYQCKDWREWVKANIGLSCADPMDRDYRGTEGQNVAAIVEGDKQDIDDTRVLLVNYDRPSVGTSMEILYAYERGKPVFIVAAPGMPISPWLTYHAREIFTDFAVAVAHIRGLFQ